MRQQRGKGFPNRAQGFATTFSSFLGCYSQVVSLMNAADSQSGGLAVQALSLFLMVSVIGM
jgi:hypothetical protein